MERQSLCWMAYMIYSAYQQVHQRNGHDESEETEEDEVVDVKSLVCAAQKVVNEVQFPQGHGENGGRVGLILLEAGL